MRGTYATNIEELLSNVRERQDELLKEVEELKEELLNKVEDFRKEWCKPKPDSEPDPDPDPSEGFTNLNAWEIGFVEALNDFRERWGPQELKFDQFLIDEAQGHSEAMADAISRGVPEDQAITDRSFVNPEVGVTGEGGLYGDYSDRPDVNTSDWYLDIWVDRFIAEGPEDLNSASEGAGYLDFAFSTPEFRKAVFDPFYDKIGVGFTHYDDGDPNTLDGYLTILVGTDDTSLNL
jgi:hypothetical protein